MAIELGQSLISDSENDKKTSRRSLQFDPFAGASSRRDNNFFESLRDFTTNTAFNVIDSALFGAPSGILNKNTETIKSDNFWEQDSESYGGVLESLGIRPYQELSAAGRFGLGTGQALGFFIPYSAISKGTRFAQKLAFSNFDKVVGETIETAIKGVPTANPLRSVIKNSLGKFSDQIPYIYRGSADQYRRFTSTVFNEVKKDAAQFAQKNGLEIGQRQIDEISKDVVESIQKMGQEGKFIEDLQDLTSKLGQKYGNNSVTRSIAGFAGRAISEGINMSIYEGIGHLARASAGAEIEGIDYNALESIKHSAGFAAAISMADFIPGGRRAGSAQDFYRFTRNALGKKRSFRQLFNDNELNDKQIKVLTSYYSKIAGKAPTVGKYGGINARDIEVGRASTDDLLRWLDDTYQANKKDLLRAIMKDGAKSVVYSLPRAAVDAIITATYLNGTENFMNAIHDESMVADYLVGAFMAMRAYQPLDSRRAMRWRYDTTIDSKFNFMESMGMNPSNLASNIKAMNQVQHDIDLAAKNYESIEGIDKIYDDVFEGIEIDPMQEGGNGMRKERDLANQFIMNYMMPIYLGRNDKPIEDIQKDYETGAIPEVNRMTDSQFSSFWDKIKDLQTADGKALENYTDLGIGRFREDFERNIAKNHADILVRRTADAAKALGIVERDNLSGVGNARNILVVKEFTNTGISEVDFFLSNLRMLEKIGLVETDKTKVAELADVSRDPDIINQISEIARSYNEDSAQYFDSSYSFSDFENPAIDYLKEYTNIVAVNKFYDAIAGNTRDGDREFDAIRREIDKNIGQTVSSRGIEIKGAEDGDQMLPVYSRFLNEIGELKRAAGLTNTSRTPKVVEYEDAKSLYNMLESNGYLHTSQDKHNIPRFYIGNHSVDQLKNDVVRQQIANSNLNKSDFIVYTVLRDRFRSDVDQKLVMPTKQKVREILSAEFTDKTGSKYVTEKQQQVLDDLIKNYSSSLERMVKTNLVKVSDDIKFSSDFNMTDIVTTIRDLYDSESRAELEVMARHAQERRDKINRAFSDLNEKIANGETSMESAREFIDSHLDALQEMSAFESGNNKPLTDLINQAQNIIRETEETVDSRSFLDKLFNPSTVDNMADIYDLSAQIAKLGNIKTSRAAFSATMSRLRNGIVENIKQDVQNADSMPLNQAYMEFVRLKGYDEARKLVTSIQRAINTDSDFDTQKMIGDVATRDIMDALRMMSSSRHSGTMQSFVARLNKLGLVDLLDSQNRGLGQVIKDDLQNPNLVVSRSKELVRRIKQMMEPSEFESNKEKILDEIQASVSTLRRRNQNYRTFRISGTGMRYDSSEKSVQTPIGNFTEKSSFQIAVVKDTYVDENGNQGKLTNYDNIDDAQYILDRAGNRAFEAGLAKRLSEDETLSTMFVVDNQGDIATHPLFVPLQANEDIGVLFGRTKENIDKLKDSFKGFESALRNQVKGTDKEYALNLHLSRIRKSLDKDLDSGIRSAIRSMYYYNHISKDMFWRMIGEGKNEGEVYVSSKNAQSKYFKYIHHVNSKNAMSFDGETLNMIADVRTKVFDKSSSEILSISKYLRKRAKDGVNVFVYDDETGIKGSTARAVAENTVDSQMQYINLEGEARERYREKLINDTIRDINDEFDALSIDQSLTDGSIFASEDAMRADVFLMGNNFEEGSTAAKMQFHDVDKSFIGKAAVRFDESVQSFMKKYDIDYIAPSSTAKSWEGKDQVVKPASWNPSLSVGENISKFDKPSGVSIKNFSSESVKYLYPAHGGRNIKANTNTSVMHFMDAEAMKDFSNKLNIESIVKKISRHAAKANTEAGIYASGLEGFFMSKYEETEQYFSHYSAAEKLMQWGLDSQDTFVRSSVMRMLKNTQYSSLLTQPRLDVVNTFLFSDSRLKSPTYSRSKNRGHVKSFGEIKLPNTKRNVDTSFDTNVIVTVVRDNDYQDIVINAAEGNLRVHSPDRTLNIEESENFSKVWDFVYKQGTYGQAYDKIQEMNMYLREEIGTVRTLDFDKNNKLIDSEAKDIMSALDDLKSLGVKDLGIAVNSHKVPKKFAADSIVNKIHSFLDEKAGHIIEANNYEIAMNHQADQDGDKLTVYMSMPFSVIRRSSDNMALAKEAPTVAPDNSPFPNVFETMTEDGNFKNESSLEGSVFNPLNYMASEKKSKYAVGSTVKMMGSTTMMDVSGLSFDGKRIMRFGNSPESNFGKASDYARITGSITQSILDAWRGVHSSLLNQRAVKDYLLFGDINNIPDGQIKRTLSNDGFKGIFNVPEGAAAGTTRGEVYRDFIREIYKTFEDVYSSLGDVYEGGVANKPEFHHLYSVHSKIKNLFNQDSYFIFNRLSSKYKHFGEKNKLSELIDLFEKPSETTANPLKSMFKFEKTWDEMIEINPQLRALDSIINQGDLMKDDDFSLHENKFIKDMFLYDEGSIAAKISSSNGGIDVLTQSFITNDGAVERMVNEFSSLKKVSPNAPKNLGMFNKAIDVKVSQLEYQRNFYNKIGDNEEVAFINEQINNLITKQKEVQSQIYKLHSKNIDTGQIIDNPRGYIHKGDVSHIYRVVSDSDGEYPRYEFVKSLKDGDKIPDWISSSQKVFMLKNPIEVKPFNKRHSIEGLAMEFATSDYVRRIQSSVGARSDASEVIFKMRNKIEKSKSVLRNINSDMMDLLTKYPGGRKNDIYDDYGAYTNIEIERLLADLENDLLNFEIYHPNTQDPDYETVIKMLLSPRVIRDEFYRDSDEIINSYKIDSKFAQSLIKYINDNKTIKTGGWFVALDNVMTSYSSQKLTAHNITPSAQHASDNVSVPGRRAEYESIMRNKSNSLIHSLIKMSSNNVMLREAIKRYNIPYKYETDKGIVYKSRTYLKSEDQNLIGCKIF